MATDISNSINQAMANRVQQDKPIPRFDLSEPRMHRFGGILRVLNLEAIPAFASNIRHSGHRTTAIPKLSCNSDLIPCKVVGPPLCGSFHIVFTLEFNDGVKWMLKISANGHHFDSVAAAALISEARTMQLLKNETTIPVPAVYAFDATSSNDLNSPFILMERIDGKPLWQGWFDDEIPKPRLEHFRIKVLQNLAEAMAQLNKFTLNRGGALEFDATGKPVGLRGAKVFDAVATYYQGMESENVSKFCQDSSTNHNNHDVYDESHGNDDISGEFQNTDSIRKVASKDQETDKTGKGRNEDEDDEDLICEKGPFDCPKSALLYDVNRSDVYRKDDEYTQGCYKALRIFIDLAFANFEDPGRRFVLNHPDLDVQNVIVADDGTLRGLIDWDGVASVPREVGCAQYPLWLMRDWVPYHYVYDEQEGKTEEDAGYEESSPAELASYRAMYAHFIEKEIERQIGGPDRLTSFGTLPKQEAQLTRRSLVMRDLNLAGSSPFLATNVMCHILNQIEQITEADWGDMDYDLLGSDFDPACSSEASVNRESDTNSNINDECDEEDQQEPEVDVMETHGDISCRAPAEADKTILEPVVSRAMTEVTEMSSATQKHYHESQILSKACETKAEAPEMAQSSKAELDVQPSSNSAPLGWGRRLLCFGCNAADKALRRVAKIGHILEDGIEEVAEVLAEAELSHQDCTEIPGEDEPEQSINYLGHQKQSGIEAFEPDSKQSTQGTVDPEQPQDMTSVQGTAEPRDTPSPPGTIELNDEDEPISIIQPVLIQDIPARKAKIIEALKAKKKDRYRFDKAAVKEELKIWEQIAIMVWCRGISLEQLQENQSKIAHWVIDTLQAEEKQEKDLVEADPVPSATAFAKQNAMQSKAEPKPSTPTLCTSQEQTGKALAPQSRTPKKKRVRKGKNRPVPASGAPLLPVLGKDNLSLPGSRTQTTLPKVPFTVSQPAMPSNEEQMVRGLDCGQKTPFLDDQGVGTPLELIPSPSSQFRPIVGELLQRAMSSENLKAICSFGTSCMKKIFSNGNKSGYDKTSLRSDSSATNSRNGDNDGSDTGKSCKSSVTSLSDKEIELDKKVERKQGENDIFETAVAHIARLHSCERGMNSNSDVCDGVEMSEAMEKMAPPRLHAFAGALDMEEASNKPWLAGRMYDPCRKEWVELKTIRQSGGPGLKEGGAEMIPTKDTGDGLRANIERYLEVGENNDLETESESKKDAEDKEQDENDTASLCDSRNAEEGSETFEDDGEFRSRNIFILLGMGKLDDIRLLRMQEGFLKLLEQY